MSLASGWALGQSAVVYTTTFIQLGGFSFSDAHVLFCLAEGGKKKAKVELSPTWRNYWLIAPK
jgi:hypothetical protein